MNLIGQTIKTHDNNYVGKVTNVESIAVGVLARVRQGLKPTDNYVAYAVENEGSPSFWTTLIARNDSEIATKYVVA